MLNVSKRIARFVLRNVRIRVRGGPARGCWWSLPTRSRFLSGVYEAPVASFVRESLSRTDVFWDIGAHFGYYTLVASGVLTRGKVFSCEPSAQNLWFLRKHVAWNSLGNVTVFPFAIAADDGHASFGGDGTGSGRLEGKGALVPVRSIDSLIASGEGEPPSFIKVDVEGAEGNVLKGSRRTLSKRLTTLVIATHGNPVHDECLHILRGFHYRIYEDRELHLILAVSQSEPRGDLWARGLFGDHRSSDAAEGRKTMEAQ